MSYLLTSGKSTQNTLEYVKDIFRLYLLTRINEVPYWEGGTPDLIPSLDEGEIKSQVGSIINSIIEFIKKSISSVSMKLEDIEIINSNMKITIKLNGIDYNYVINRSN